MFTRPLYLVILPQREFLDMKLITYLQTAHQLPRRTIVQLIKNKSVMLNDLLVEDFWQTIVQGTRLDINDPQLSIHETIHEITYSDSQIILYHKPIGYVVSHDDPHNKTIYSLLPPEFQTFHYIGRLDKDSTWLLLLTNNPSMVHELSHPSKTVYKTYKVRIDSWLDDNQIEQCKAGMRVDENWVKVSWPEEWDFLKCEDIYQQVRQGYTQLTMKLIEGHKRHIRRLLKALHKKVYTLHRTAFGPYKLSDIKLGEWKHLFL